MNCCGENLIDILDFMRSSGRFRTITSWYLKKITSPRGETITFNYDLNTDNVTSPYISLTKSFGELEAGVGTESCIQTVQEHVYLKSIVADDIRVDFTMENRDDLRKNTLFIPTSLSPQFPQGQKLKRYTGLTITGLDPASTLNKSIVIKQGYFNQAYEQNQPYNDTEDEVRWLRSRLDKVTIDDQEYRFYYENGAKGVPDKLTTGMDHFGFYNGRDDVAHLMSPALAQTTGSCDGDVATGAETLFNQLGERLVDFSYGKAGLLTKVQYPTRGYSVFEYETHTYLPDITGVFHEAPGQKSAGGARIKSIKEYDYTDKLVRHKYYWYTKLAVYNPAVGDSTSGLLMTPIYNRAKWYYPGTNHCNYMYASNSSIPGNNSAEGKVLGYSRVHEFVQGDTSSYHSSYYFENKPNNILNYNAAIDGQPNINGVNKENRNYNSQRQLLQRVENSQYNNVTDTIHAYFYQNQVQGSGMPTPSYLSYIGSYSLKATFNMPKQIVITTPAKPSQVVETAYGDITGINSATVIRKNLEFNQNFLLKSETIIGSGMDTVRTDYRRPMDYAFRATTLNYMLDPNVNQVDYVIEEITKRRTKVIASTFNRYTLENTNKVNLKATYAYNKDLGSFTQSYDGDAVVSSYEKKVDYTKYDATTGKLLEYVAGDGIYNSFVWGFNGKLPIVQGVGVKHDKLTNAYNAAVIAGAAGSTAYENAIRSHTEVAGGQVSTFNYNPQVGVSKVTSPNGIKKTFKYDQYGRLSYTADHDDNLLQQNKYHFRQFIPTRILAVSGDIVFPTIVPDYYIPSSIPTYVRCDVGLGTKILKLSNTGTDDLEVSSFSLGGFAVSWGGGTIAPGTSVDVVIKANQPGSYGATGGTMNIYSNKTSGGGPGNTAVSVTGNYAAKNCNISVSPSVVDFGAVMGGFYQQNVTITNNGNYPVKLTTPAFDWDGTTIDFGVNDFIDPEFGVTRNAICLQPGVSQQLEVRFNPNPGSTNIQQTTKLSLLMDACPSLKDIVLLKGEKVTSITRTLSVPTTPIAMPSFTTTSAVQTITIYNTGNSPVDVNSVNSTNSMFSVSPASFTIPAHGDYAVNVVFTPTAFTFTSQNTTLTFNSSNATTGGNNTVTASGQQTALRSISLPSSPVTFSGPNTNQTVNITNNGNDYLDVTGYSIQSTPNFSVIGFTAANLAPGQSTTIVIRQNYTTSEVITVTINSNKNYGDNTFQIKQN